MSALPPKADIDQHRCDVRFVPKADILHCGKERRYSITSSARPSNGSRNVRPRAFAVFRLSTNSTLHHLHDRQIGRLLALEDTCGIDANLYKRTSQLLAAS